MTNYIIKKQYIVEYSEWDYREDRMLKCRVAFDEEPKEPYSIEYMVYRKSDNYGGWAFDSLADAQKFAAKKECEEYCREHGQYPRVIDITNDWDALVASGEMSI